MENFVELQTVYKDRQSQLNIDFLSSVYNDRDKLREIIRGLLAGHISIKKISGKSVLLKPNWVKHCENEHDDICLCTHENFILAFLEEIVLFHPSKVLIADAPVNICMWTLLLSNNFLKEVDRISNKSGVEVRVKDFRRTISDFHTNRIMTDLIPISEYVIFDVGYKSQLEPITSDKNNFRINGYNPDDMKKYHGHGMHKYCIARDFFDYDVVFTLPKLKTHQKAGFTNALKILIGINGDKDYLPHHRLGATNNGGDCYKDDSILRRIGEWSADNANRNLGNWKNWLYRAIAKGSWILSRSDPGMTLAASWYGNDTIWRTVIDIQRIAQYGSIGKNGEGVLNDERQRIIYNMCDGIVGGQGNGPLSPDPLPLGVVAFSDNAFLMDVVGGILLGMNEDKIPLLHYAKNITKYTENIIYLNGERIAIDKLKQYSVNAQMPIGWIHYND